MALMEKCSCTCAGSTSANVAKTRFCTAALAMTVSSFEILCSDCRKATAVLASVAEVLSILTMMRVLLGSLWTPERAVDEGVEGSRTAAMTVVLGRER